MLKEVLLYVTMLAVALGSNPSDDQKAPQEKLDRLRSLPYFSAPADHAPTGLLGIHESEVMPGYNLFANRFHNTAALIDNHGRIVHQWARKDHSSWLAVEMSPRADLFVLHGWDAARKTEFPNEHGFPTRLTKLAPDSSVIWSVVLPVHHDIQILPDGTLLVLLERTRKISGGTSIVDNTIAHLSADGKVLREISLYDLVRRTPGLTLEPLPRKTVDTPADIFHSNTVRQLSPERSKKLVQSLGNTAEAKRIFAAGNILVSSRHQNFVVIINPASERIVWWWGHGELDGPHCARFLENGHVLVFDNGLARGWTRVLEIDPIGHRIVWSWTPRDRKSFYVMYGGACQRLPNGNTLITDSAKVIAFEVTPDNRIVWKWANPDQTFMYRVHRVQERFFTPEVRKQFLAASKKASSAGYCRDSNTRISPWPCASGSRALPMIVPG